MHNKYLRLLFCLVILFCNVVFSQTNKPSPVPKNLKTKDTEELLEDARDRYYSKDLEGAKKYYEELLRRDSVDLNYNYEMGLCYYETPEQRLKSLEYFERVERNLGNDMLPELFYYLGKVYHLANRFDDAIKAFRKYLKEFETETDFVTRIDYEGIAIIKEVESDIEACKKAKETVLRPKNKIEIYGKVKEYEITSMGTNINSIYDDYGAILPEGDSLLYFTSRRKPTDKKAKEDPEDEKYYEDVYFSKLIDEGWTIAQPVGEPINTSEHDAVNFISPDGKRMCVFRNTGNGKFFQTELQNGKWVSPKQMENAQEIMLGDWNTNLFMTADEKTVLFVSDRIGGFGSRDIWMSEKGPDGKWGKAKNIGSEVNSPFDEESPFLSPDGKNLFFASRGHLAMGGFDVFKSTLVNGEWTEPVNMGYPINTAGDDLYFTINSDGDVAYYSSTRAESEEDKGDMDIYAISLCDEDPQTTVKGLVISKEVPVNMTITVIDQISGLVISRSTIGKDGKYSLNLLRNRPYLLKFEGKDVVHFESEITLPKQCRVYDLFQRVKIIRKVDLELSQWVQEVTISNAFFDIRKKVLQAKFKGHDDEVQNYSAYINNIDINRTRLNLKHQFIKTCISDVVDLAKLILIFNDSTGREIEASIFRKGVFVFNEVVPGANGIFKLSGADADADYVPLVKFGVDTIALISNGKNEYVWPKAKMYFTSKGALKQELSLLCKGNNFNFLNVNSNEQGMFRLEGGDSAVVYRINYITDGEIVSSSWYQDGVVFPCITLTYINEQNQLVETANLNKSNEFNFAKVPANFNGRFQSSVNNNNLYHVNILAGNEIVRSLKFKDGVVFPSRILSCYKPDGTFIEEISLAPNNIFRTNKIQHQDTALFFLKGDHVDTAYKINIDFGKGAVLAVRSEDEFLRSDRMKGEDLQLLLVKDSLKVVNDQLSYEQLMEQALAALTQQNSEKFKKQMAGKLNEAENYSAFDDTPDLSFPRKKLHCFDVNGKVLASAQLTKSGKFIFEPISNLMPFVLFKPESVDEQELKNYNIYLKLDSVTTTKYAFEELVYEDGFYYLPKTMNFFNDKGALVETATINRNGVFVFRTLNPEESGVFKLTDENDPGLIAYGIDLVKNGVVKKQLQFENGELYPRRTLVAYNSSGDVLQKTLMNKNGYFLFTKLSVDENVLYTIDATDADLLSVVKISSDGKNFQALRVENNQFVSLEKVADVKLTYLEGADSLAFIQTQKQFLSVNKADTSSFNNVLNQLVVYLSKNHAEEIIAIKEEKALDGKTLSVYNTNGELIETAKLSRKGSFTFTKISPDDFVLYKIQGTDPNPNYTINFANNKAIAKSVKLGGLQSESGYLFDNLKMNYYNVDGKLIETSTVNKEGKFIFKNLDISENGVFKIEENDPGLVVFGIEVMKSNMSMKQLNYQQGKVYEQQNLVFYNSNGQIIEKATNRNDGSFVFKKISLFDEGKFVVEGHSTPDIASLNVIAGGINSHVLRNKDAYVAANANGISKINVNALSKNDALLYNSLKAELLTLGNSEVAKRNEVVAKMASLIEKNDTMRVIYAFNKSGQIVDKAFLTPQGTFEFQNIPIDEFVVYKMDGVDRGVNYVINIRNKSSVESLQTTALKREGDYMYLPQVLSYYDKSGKAIETVTINKNGEFLFQKIYAEDNGYYKMQTTDPGLVAYTIKVPQKNKPTKTMQFQSGNVYETQILSFYNSKGVLKESVVGRKDGTFNFSKLDIYEMGYFSLDGTADTSHALKIYINQKPLQLLKSDVGYVKPAQLALVQLSELKGDDSLKLLTVKKEISLALAQNDSLKFLEKIAELKSLVVRNNDAKQELSMNAGKKLVAYSNDGKVLEKATLTKGGFFVFEKIPVDQFVYYLSEGISEDNTYLVKLKRPNANDEVVALKDLKAGANVYYSQKELVYYENGKPMDSAMVTKDGKFTFNRLSSYEKGEFKMAGDNPGNQTYILQFKKSEPVQYQSGEIFPLQTLFVYDSDGKLIEKALNKKDGSFVLNDPEIYKRKLEIKGKGSKELSSINIVTPNQSLVFVKTQKEIVPISDINTVKLASLSQSDANRFNEIKSLIKSKDLNDPTYTLLVKEIGALVARNDSLLKNKPAKDLAVVAVATAKYEPVKLVSTKGTEIADSNAEPSSYSNILFDYNKSIVKDEYKFTLNELVEYLNENKKTKVEISGHTDSKGNHQYNMELSRKRVNAVASYLNKHGVSNSRIIKKQYGKTKPIAPNENPDGSDNPSGRAQNRRVEVRVK